MKQFELYLSQLYSMLHYTKDEISLINDSRKNAKTDTSFKRFLQ